MHRSSASYHTGELDIKLLQNKLKGIGLDPSKYLPAGNATPNPELISLLKSLQSIDVSALTWQEKIVWHSKLNQIPAATPRIRVLPPAGIKPVDKKVDKPAPADRSETGALRTTLAVVKFIAENRSHGYALPFTDFKEFGQANFYRREGSFLHKEDLEGIHTGQLVRFQSRLVREKPEAFQLSSYLPVFVFGKKDPGEKKVFILLNRFADQEIKLLGQADTGLFLVKLEWLSRNSCCRILEQRPSVYNDAQLLDHGGKLLAMLFRKFTAYKEEIDWLKDRLGPLLTQQELHSIYEEALDLVEKDPLPVVDHVLELLEAGLPKELLAVRKSRLNRISFSYWIKGSPEVLPPADERKTIAFWKQEVIPGMDAPAVRAALLKWLRTSGDSTALKEVYRYLAEKTWKIETREQFLPLVDFLREFQSLYPDILLEEKSFECSQGYQYIELWTRGVIKSVSEKRVKEYIHTLRGPEEKSAVIESLPVEDSLHYYKQFPELSSRYQDFASRLMKKELAGLPGICFTLESDGERIYQLAWVDQHASVSEKDFDNIGRGAIALIGQMEKNSLVIGHNIRSFDLSVLERRGYQSSPGKIWDTCEMEILLDPCRFSYGLKTQHSALSDSRLTYALFQNQLARIIGSDDTYEQVRPFLPVPVQEYLQPLRKSTLWKDSRDLLLKEASGFFRPQPAFHALPEGLATSLQAKLRSPGRKIVVAPRLAWNIFSRSYNAWFVQEEYSVLNEVLDREKITAGLAGQLFLQTALLRYHSLSLQKGMKPYYHQLPPILQDMIGEDRIPLLCRNERAQQDIVCVCPEETHLLKKLVPDVSEARVIVLLNQLSLLTGKHPLGEEIDFSTLFDRLKDEPVWLQMSGGRNFIPLQQRQCQLLGITDYPPFVKNIWMEKAGKARFKVWCNASMEKAVGSLGAAGIEYIDWEEDPSPKNNTCIVRPDTKRSGYIAEQKRVNPESLYKRLYWIYQLKMLEGLHSGRPMVLVLNDDKDIMDLEAYARRKGYFVPDRNAVLARQVELLHRDENSKKILITSFDKLDKIIACNDEAPLDFFWDHFLLYEKRQMLGGGYQGYEQEDTSGDDWKAGRDGAGIEWDSYRLLKACKPLVDYFSRLIHDNDKESVLYLMDPRFTDFFGIEDNFHLKSRSVLLWVNERQYEEDRAAAEDFFKDEPGPEIASFDIEEAKRILEKIFLKKDDGEEFHWFDYQRRCLDEILPAKKDLLISLPTGAGKSLMFQAPALFRAAFSNKLTIVVSPLRALMQDQVEALWAKGFFSNVDYLSGDRSQMEIRDIYRRLAGGEIALLYLTPERFRSRSFGNAFMTRLDADNGLEFAVFDEAHCISQWGQEFRPDYLNAAYQIAAISKNPVFQCRTLLFSATISEQVFEDLRTILPGIVPVQGAEKSYNPVRDHIAIRFKHNIAPDERLKEIAQYLKEGGFNPELSRAIVFVKSRRKSEESALLMPDNLREAFGNNWAFADRVGAFHAGMDAERRRDTYEKYKSGEISILFATKAFGMGMDIPDIHYITHHSPPGTFEDFLQEIGRAGRNEEKRIRAGFDSRSRPIKALCLTAPGDFRRLKDQLHDSRITWNDIKNIRSFVVKYMADFRKAGDGKDIPVVIPFDAYSKFLGKTEPELDNKFRMALYWLERLERIRLGYFTITHLSFDKPSLYTLSDKLHLCRDENVRKVCNVLIREVSDRPDDSLSIQMSVTSLRSATGLSLEKLFESLFAAHKSEMIVLQQEIVATPTGLRTEEIKFNRYVRPESYECPALQTIFRFAARILEKVPANESRIFEEEDLDTLLKESMEDLPDWEMLPWSTKEKQEEKGKEKEQYLRDIVHKRKKHALTVLKLLGKIHCESKMEKLPDSKKKLLVRQSVFNGYHKKEEWTRKLQQLERDCLRLLAKIGSEYFRSAEQKYNWADLVGELELPENVQYLSDLFFLLSVLGYVKSGDLLPPGTEIYPESDKEITERDVQSGDKKIFDEFVRTAKLRELKLIALQALSSLPPQKHDAFIRAYFSCNSMDSLVRMLEEYLSPDDPALWAFRDEAIELEKQKLNTEQRLVYDADENSHISVMAGPGSGKTHTLVLRVARLVHETGIAPEEIMVLAYNRAVVAELRTRLSALFASLGYESMSRRLKIYTFQGMVKKYAGELTKEKDLKDWEDILLKELNVTPGLIMNQVGALKYILVDEFQDINDTRLKLLKRLHELTSAWIFIIGDPNQSIYGYERVRQGGSMSPWPYYQQFNALFHPGRFTLYDNHRSYPAILHLAAGLLSLPEEYSHLIPRATRQPEAGVITAYTEVIDNTINGSPNWWDKIAALLEEQVEGRQYRQIAVFFRTNNEVYRGLQKIKSLHLHKIRIRIQGGQPYEFTRVRECFAVLSYLEKRRGQIIPDGYEAEIKAYIEETIVANQAWNAFYLRVIHAVILDFLADREEHSRFDDLVDFITELTAGDDGQFYKIYEKHIKKVSPEIHETEIVLTTMHKVKGLEFDAVVIPPSFSDLPMKNGEELQADHLADQIEEEKRLAFVAYTRARFRLVVHKHHREIALEHNRAYTWPDVIGVSLGIPVKPGLEKIFISWTALSSEFFVNDYIGRQVKAGDLISVFFETPDRGYIFHDGKKVGKLSKRAFPRKVQARWIRNFVVSEVLVWKYEETAEEFRELWGAAAIGQKFIYLIDFAGFGTVETGVNDDSYINELFG